MQQEPPRQYRFGPYVVDTARASVFRNGERLDLRPKAFDALLHLIRHAGSLVKKDDLIESLWPGVVVTEDSLFKCIREVRDTFGDGDHRLIRTVPRRGYVFEGTVSVESSLPNPVAADAPEALPRRPDGGVQPARSAYAVRFAAVAVTAAITAIATIAAIAAIAAIRLTGAWVTTPPVPGAVNRFDYDLVGLGVHPIPGSPPGIGNRPIPVISPDGRLFVIRTDDGLYLRRMDELEATQLVDAEQSLSAPFFSPDGQMIAYYSRADRELRRIAIRGGASVPIAEGLHEPLTGASWAPDGTILVGQESGIVRIRAGGGKPELVIPAHEGERLFGPTLLPDRESVLFSAARGIGSDIDIVVASLATGERRVVHSGGGNAHYLPSGHLVYEKHGNLYVVAFDIETLSVRGAVQSLESGLLTTVLGHMAPALFSVSDDGTLIYLTNRDHTLVTDDRSLVWTDRAGNDTAVGVSPCACFEVDLSPDGTRVATSVFDGQPTESDIWIWSLETQTQMRLTPEVGVQHFVVWSPDSRTIVYQSDFPGIFSRAANGTGAIDQLFENPYGMSITSPFALDAAGDVLFTVGQRDIHVLKLSDDGRDEPLLDHEYVEARPALSPDGRLLAYESDETGTTEIYVRPYPNVDSDRWKVSEEGGIDARWSADGTRLYFLSPTHLMEAEVESKHELRIGTPTAVFEFPGDGYWRGSQHNYDVTADGARFLRIKLDSVSYPQPRAVIVQNWTTELERLVPVD